MNKYSLGISTLIALGGSLIANALLVAIILPLTSTPSSVMTFHVAGPTGVFTTIGVIGAAIVLALLRRFSTNPNNVFVWVAVVVFLLSLLPDIFVHHLGPMFAQITAGGAILLMTMHLACALITVYALIALTKSNP